MTFDDRMTISTPEGIDLEVVLAGLGSRFAAGAFDTFIQLVLLFLFWFAFLIGGAGSGLSQAVFYLLSFVVIFGYYVIFETLNHGRTPGKALAGLRVVQSGGQPVGFMSSALRTIVRLADGFIILTFFLVPVGMVSILATGKNQRLGDLAAGTVVIREPRTRAVAVPTAAPWMAPPAPPNVPPPMPPPNAPYMQWDVSAVTNDEEAVIRRFLDRRMTLDPNARLHLATDLAARLHPKIAGASTNWHPESFLEGIVAAKAARR
jgi:uncharacterized RDD family membrane protein YckC